jgi:hypothetical protein
MARVNWDMFFTLRMRSRTSLVLGIVYSPVPV